MSAKRLRLMPNLRASSPVLLNAPWPSSKILDSIALLADAGLLEVVARYGERIEYRVKRGAECLFVEQHTLSDEDRRTQHRRALERERTEREQWARRFLRGYRRLALVK